MSSTEVKICGALEGLVGKRDAKGGENCFRSGL